MRDASRLGRREVLRRSLVVIAGAPLLGSALAACGSGELECGTGGLAAPQLAMRSALHYTEHAGDPARRCSGCQLYTGNATACGTCSSVPGSIHPNGSCDAFNART